MASLQDAFQPIIQPQHASVKKEVRMNAVGHAYGPEYSNGVAAYGYYVVQRDPETKELYIDFDHGKEFLTKDGKVIGREDTKKYRIVIDVEE